MHLCSYLVHSLVSGCSLMIRTATKPKPRAPNPFDYRSPAGIAWAGYEDDHQAAFFCWAGRAARIGFEAANDMDRYSKPDPMLKAAVGDDLWAHPELKWMHAIPNGGSRDAATAGRLKTTGVTSGVSDIFLPCARHGYHGLYLELKVKRNVMSAEQIDFCSYVTAQTYAFSLCYGWEELRADVVRYLSA